MKFKTGNVVRTSYGIVIITGERGSERFVEGGQKVKYTSITWVSFAYNSSGSTPEITYYEKASCNGCLEQVEEEDEEGFCIYCNGTGMYDKEIIGMDKAEKLAETTKDYIIERLLKNFEFK